MLKKVKPPIIIHMLIQNYYSYMEKKNYMGILDQNIVRTVKIIILAK